MAASAQCCPSHLLGAPLPARLAAGVLAPGPAPSEGPSPAVPTAPSAILPRVGGTRLKPGGLEGWLVGLSGAGDDFFAKFGFRSVFGR